MPDNHEIKLKNELSRRQFLALSTVATAGLVVAGCAANPVTGKSQLMMVSEAEEIQIDKAYSPEQLSLDYGNIQDAQLYNYVSGVGKRLAQVTHRTQMPYDFHTVNAVYANAYAFSGGTIAATRGILLSLQSEGALAALLGHELGHVNARHTAQQMSKSTLTSALLQGVAIAAGAFGGQALGQLAGTLGQLGGSAFLASYSRDNEREADALAMEYMTKAGYGTKGHIELMTMLNNLKDRAPSSFEVLFATHPMSQERFDTSLKMAASDRYKSFASGLDYSERYMDSTKKLRTMKDPIEKMQKSMEALSQKNPKEAEKLLKEALQKVPNDYAGLLLMAKTQEMLGNSTESMSYAETAKKAYPGEPQASMAVASGALAKGDFNTAFTNLSQYDQKLPGNPKISFYRGFCLEKMGRNKEAAQLYVNYLNSGAKDQSAQYAYSRLSSWGYVR